jgi:nicotinamidase-related amidase
MLSSLPKQAAAPDALPPFQPHRQGWRPSRAKWLPARVVPAEVARITDDGTLVIIDMQTGWFDLLTDNAVQTTTESILRELDDAMEVGAPVLVVEYRGAKSTHDDIREKLHGYQRWQPVSKTGMNGADQILQACSDHGYGTKPLRLCGIFTDQCVQETSWNLAGRIGVSVDVVMDACCTEKSEYDWRNFKGGQVQLVRQLPRRELLRAAA